MGFGARQSFPVDHATAVGIMTLSGAVVRRTTVSGCASTRPRRNGPGIRLNGQTSLSLGGSSPGTAEIGGCQRDPFRKSPAKPPWHFSRLPIPVHCFCAYSRLAFAELAAGGDPSNCASLQVRFSDFIKDF